MADSVVQEWVWELHLLYLLNINWIHWMFGTQWLSSWTCRWYTVPRRRKNWFLWECVRCTAEEQIRVIFFLDFLLLRKKRPTHSWLSCNWYPQFYHHEKARNFVGVVKYCLNCYCTLFCLSMCPECLMFDSIFLLARRKRKTSAWLHLR